MGGTEIKFESERTKMFAQGLYRTGQARIKRKGYDIHILRHAEKGKTSYHVHVMKGSSFDNAVVKTLGGVRKIVDNIENYNLANTAGGL